ncbi:MAG TPA: transglutaminase domain-containing protein [Candidatus Paceibacterota bacterium]|nr:transglutaminase domain-containing protein [Verrucomicrobiota bacterium]HRY51716.1 transglutaminase domain-containing protein [Candidatus Paceibacterota bacterium]
MKTPAGLIGSTLLFWGWQTGRIWWGALAAVLLEGGRLARWQWELGEVEYRRIWDYSTLMAGALFFFFLGSEERVRSTFVFVQWLPLVYLPLVMAQWFGPWDKMPFHLFSWLVRRRRRKALLNPRLGGASMEIAEDRGLNITYPYFALCLLSAGSAYSETLWYYAGLSFFGGWALWLSRPRRLPEWLWIVVFAGAVGVAFKAHQSLRILQQMVEGQIGNFISSLAQRELDSNENHTAIGQVGKLKLSGRIVMRLQAGSDGGMPALLREASYQAFQRTSWFGASREYAAVTPEGDDAWILRADRVGLQTVGIARYMKRGKGTLALPGGAVRIERLPAVDMETNSLGVVRVAEAPGFSDFLVHYSSGPTRDSPPERDDLDVPETERAALAQILNELQLARAHPEEVLKSLRAFFQERFEYSTWLRGTPPASTNTLTPLGDFLLKRRAGHCEYFATATVLLLRQLGIPARYATGYAVMESAGSGRYVVRERHAHAWCLVNVRGFWEDFDTTPSTWGEIEARRASAFESVRDAISWLRFQFSRWRWSQSGLRQYLLWLLIPAAAGLFWQFFLAKRRAKTAGSASERTLFMPLTGADSELYQIAERLRQRGFQREVGENWTAWFQRIGPELDGNQERLSLLIRLHNRYRFDPAGLSSADRSKLREQAAEWLATLRRGKSRRS